MFSTIIVSHLTLEPPSLPVPEVPVVLPALVSPEPPAAPLPLTLAATVEASAAVSQSEPASLPLGFGFSGADAVLADGGNGVAVVDSIAVDGGAVGGQGGVVDGGGGEVVHGGQAAVVLVVVVGEGRQVAGHVAAVVDVHGQAGVAVAVAVTESTVAVAVSKAAVAVTVAGSVVTRPDVCLLLSPDLVVAAVESLGLRAVKVEPPVADEVLLVEHGAVGTEERVLGQAALAVGGANVEHLALGRRISVVAFTTKHLLLNKHVVIK